MKVLTVVSGVHIKTTNLCTVNKSFEKIISQYGDHWDKIHLVCPSDSELKIIKEKSNFSDKIYLTSIGSYKKNLVSRLYHFFGGYKKIIKNYLLETEIIDESDCIQFRYPNFFVLMIAFGLRKLNLNTCYYIAGNEVELISINQPYLSFFAKIKRKFENYTMKGRPLITTGDKLAILYQNVGNTFPYYSTTHTEVIKRTPKENYQNCLYVGSIYEGKRVIDLVKAFKILNENFPTAKCTIVGTGPSLKFIRDYIEKHNLENVINLKGYIGDRNKLKKIYEESDFLILPSISEGTPRVFPEAMSHGVIPLGVKDVASNNHIIKPYINGALFKAKSPESIANELSYYFNNREVYSNSLVGIFEYANNHTLQKELNNVWAFLIKEFESNNI